MAPLGGASFYIGLYREIHLKYSISKTAELIWGMGIQVCAKQGADIY